MAKYYGNYEILDGGESSEGVEVMTGAPYIRYMSTVKDNAVDKEAFWQALLATNTNKESVVANTWNGENGETDQDSNSNGVPYGHALSLKKVVIVTDASGNSIRLVELRNPWG